MTYLYRICGMTVSSEIVLPGAHPLTVGEPDVVMRRGKVAQALPNPLASNQKWDIDDDHILLRGCDAGRFLLTGGREVLFQAADGAPDEVCAAYLQSLVISVLLHQRGGLVLHASAVQVGASAVLFCAASGEGKSTLAAMLSARGHGLFCDDISLVTFDEAGRPCVSPDEREMKLTDTSIQVLNLESGRGAPVPGAKEKAFVAGPVTWTGGALPLGAIYMLRTWRHGAEISRLDTATALQALKRNAHRPSLVRKSGRSAQYFEATARMLRHTSVFTARRPRDLAQLPQTALALEAHWRSIGLS